jgi:signal transduction histidine kinase
LTGKGCGSENEPSEKQAGAADLVRQILALARKSDAKKEPLSLADIVTEALQLIRASLPSSIDIHQDIRDSEGQIVADGTQIHQVVMNLCTNAYHAMGRSGILRVTVKRLDVLPSIGTDMNAIDPGPYVHLSITDNGCGMDQDTLSRIFDPYFTTKEKGAGTGLGLAMVHSIVKNQGGFIFVHSTPGDGSTFDLYFPRITGGEYRDPEWLRQKGFRGMVTKPFSLETLAAALRQASPVEASDPTAM